MSENTENTEQTEQTQEPKETEKPKTFTQPELDREADRRVAAALSKYKAQEAKRIEEAKSQGEKLASLSAEDKAKAELEAQRKELEAQKNELKQRELQTATKSVLQENGLPVDLSEQLVKLGDAESIKDAVNALKSTVDERVNSKVEELATSKKPQNPSSDLTDGVNDPFNKIINSYKK